MAQSFFYWRGGVGNYAGLWCRVNNALCDDKRSIHFALLTVGYERWRDRLPVDFFDDLHCLFNYHYAANYGLVFFRHMADGYILGLLYLFMMVAYSGSVKRMSILINNALYYRFDNAMLVGDLQRLILSVSNANKSLEKISITDELTGASNYRAFRVRL
jgi:hypothetical protein